MRPFQWTGIILFSLILGLFVLGFVAPQIYAPLVPPPTSVFINRRDTWEDVEDTAGESSEESTAADPPIEELAHMEKPIVWEDSDDDEDGAEADGTASANNGCCPASDPASEEHDSDVQA